MAATLLQPAFTLRSCERCDHVGERAEVDTLSSLDGFDAECSCKVALACSRRPEEVDDLVVVPSGPRIAGGNIALNTSLLLEWHLLDGRDQPA